METWKLFYGYVFTFGGGVIPHDVIISNKVDYSYFKRCDGSLKPT